MSLKLSSNDYVDYIICAQKMIASQGEYLTALDAATGDGDHWTNINSGYKKLVLISDELEKLSVKDMFKKIAMTLMATVGGSSGVLLGSAYIAVAKEMSDKEYMGLDDIVLMYQAMLDAIMKRGEVIPGQKTMIDAIYPVTEIMNETEGISEVEALTLMKNAALDGAQDTKYMEAVRGRACYRIDKGVGHLDPGAVSMAMLIETFMDFCIKKLN